ncbi:putative gustatory receptor 47b [Drosophila pseudoobscura]|uniref:Gustatory receptor n=1 Tax=Drosophila pseudoobscura pseudoobscura TaxID=46245 RepID=A0A6I8V4J9_DROPS|nr:putative gustatory receptor 47b [Drosophila pseudoobscura]
MKPRKSSSDGFIYCYGNLYSLLFYWGLVTFRVRTQSDGGAASSPVSVLYAVCVRCFAVCGYLGSVLIKLEDERMAAAMIGHLTPVVKVIIMWECLSSSITYVENFLTLDVQRRRHVKLLANMQGFDLDISEEFPSVRWNYQRTRSKYWYGTVIVTICFFSFSLSLILNMARCTCGLSSTLLMAGTYTLLTSSLGLVGFVHIAIMDFVRLRLRLIQKLLHQEYEGSTGRDRPQTTVHRRIAKLFQFTKRCSHLLAELNAVFGFAAAAGFFYEFSLMTCFVYVICQKVLGSEAWDLEYTFMLLHVTLHSYKLIITSTYGYLLKREKRNCLRLLGLYSQHFPQQPLARSQVEDFQHWRMHNRQAALIGSSIQLSVSTIFLVYNGMANYVIILVQLLFQQQQIKERQRELGRDVDIVGPMGPRTHLD